MAEQAQFLGCDDEVIVTAPAGGYNSGDVIQVPDLRAGVVQGLNAIAQGESATAATSGRYRIAALSTAVFASGDLVGWDNGNSNAVVTGDVNKDFEIGRAAAAKASGETTVDVLLNGQGPAA